MSQSVLRPFSMPRATAGPGQGVLLRRAITVGLAALITLLCVGARNPIALSVLPGVAGLSALAVDELNLRRRRRGRRVIQHRLCAAAVGLAVLASALIVFSAT